MKTETTQREAVDLDRLVRLLDGIRVELDSAIKQVDENEILGFEHGSWRHLVAAKDAVGIAILSLPNSQDH
jgi:hypothetical protein